MRSVDEVRAVMHAEETTGKPQGAGEVKIPTALAPIERRVGFACKIAKWKTGVFRTLQRSKCVKMFCKVLSKSSLILEKCGNSKCCNYAGLKSYRNVPKCYCNVSKCLV